MSPSGLSDLRKLSNIISNAVDLIEQTLTARSVDFPSLDTPYDEAGEEVRTVPEVIDATVAIVAAAEQLAMVARAPSLTMLDVSFKFHLCAALRVALEADVAEFLREFGPSHVEFIANQKNIDAAKLARILRMLATNHIFMEISPDVFANNRLSSTLDSGSSCAHLAADPSAKLVRFPAIISFMLDASFKGGAYLADVVLDPATAHSTSPNDAAFCKAFDYDGPMWDLIEIPGNERLREMFGAAMLGITALANPDSILEVFDWASLSSGSVVVDVGGGIGTQMVLLARKFNDLKLVVQDREAICIDSTKYVMTELPSVVEAGRLQVQAHDFFEPQPVKNADVFYVRHVCHDWPDASVVKLLQQLRDAAKPDTQLVLHDSIIQHACVEPMDTAVGNELRRTPPEPLLANWGRANSEMYNMDMQMMAVYHAQERTLMQFRALLAQSGWKIIKFSYGSRPMAIANHSIVAVPSLDGQTCNCLIDVLEHKAHGIFTPQPVKDAAVFYLRHVIHDWPDVTATEILKQLRDAAQPHTKLVILDLIMQFACADADNDFAERDFLGTPPEPLLANWGRANSEMYNIDMQMMAAHYARERTLTQFRSLLSQSGWKICKVNYGSRPMAVANHSIVATPIPLE